MTNFTKMADFSGGKMMKESIEEEEANVRLKLEKSEENNGFFIPNKGIMKIKIKQIRILQKKIAIFTIILK